MRHAAAARALSLALLLAVAGCAEPPTLAPIEGASPTPQAPPPLGVAPSPALVALSCTATIASRAVRCDAPSTIGANGDVIVGGQNVFMKLTSSNLIVDGQDCPSASVPDVTMGCFSFDVNVKSLILQPIGTTDGGTLAPDANGVRVFFSKLPTPIGPGRMVVSNPTDVATFTASNQPYYQYNQVLEQGNTSYSLNWQFQISSDVTSFGFQLFVSAAVQYPLGYIDGLSQLITLNPGEVMTVPGTVRSYVGGAVPGQMITVTSGDPSVVSGGNGQVTAGSARGVTTLTFASGARPPTRSAVVDVCPSENVVNGSNLTRSITNTDCFTAFHENDGFLPGTNYRGDLYRIALTAGQYITVTLDGGGSLDTWVVLADPLGRAVASNDDDGIGPFGIGSHIEHLALMDGVYVIQATTYGAGATGSYVINVDVQ